MREWERAREVTEGEEKERKEKKRKRKEKKEEGEEKKKSGEDWSSDSCCWGLLDFFVSTISSSFLSNNYPGWFHCRRNRWTNHYVYSSCMPKFLRCLLILLHDCLFGISFTVMLLVVLFWIFINQCWGFLSDCLYYWWIGSYTDFVSLPLLR